MMIALSTDNTEFIHPEKVMEFVIGWLVIPVFRLCSR